MSFPISPGVYPNEVDKSFIVGATANSIGAIVVDSPKGESFTRKLVTSNKQFLDTFGDPSPDRPSMYAALAFLEQGKRLWVVRAVDQHSGGSAAVASSITVVDALAVNSLTFSALGEGVWGNDLMVSVSATANDQFTVTVNDDSGAVTVVLETFTVSKTSLKKDGYGRSMYIEDVINNQSEYVRVVDHVAGGAPVAGNYALTGGGDGVSVNSADIILALAEFSNKDLVEISLLMQGGWEDDAVRDELIAIAEDRTDCFAILDMPFAQIGTAQAMVDYVQGNGFTAIKSTSFAAIYGGWVTIYDAINDKVLDVPPSGHVGAVMAYTAETSEVWFAPAGLRRGGLNVLGTTITFTEGERDLLYENRINCIQTFVGEGVQVFGQKTLQSAASALDRINVRMLMITIEKSIAKAVRPFVFEFNDEFSRENITSIVESYMEDVKVRRGVVDYKVVCDETNNTAAVIDANKLILDLYVKPTRAAEFIQVNAIITPSGVSFG